MKSPTKSNRPATDSTLEKASQLPATLPIHLPAALVVKLRRLAIAADIEGGADCFVAKVLGDIVDDTAADILINGWEITNPATIARLYEIESVKA